MKDTLNTAKLLTTEEAAEIMTMAPKTLVNMRANKEGPKFVKIGNRVRYRYADIMKFIDQCVVSPGAA